MYCAAALRILAHGNGKVKAKIVGRGGITPLLKLCDPELVSDDTGAYRPIVQNTDSPYWSPICSCRIPLENLIGQFNLR